MPVCQLYHGFLEHQAEVIIDSLPHVLTTSVGGGEGSGGSGGGGEGSGGGGGGEGIGGGSGGREGGQLLCVSQ